MRSRALALWLLVVVTLSCASAYSATIHGYVLDPNWYAKHPKLTFPQVYGTGQYEYGVAGNIANSPLLGFSSNTENYGDNYNWGVFGYFRKPNQSDGVYTLATWDNWWRPAFAFNQNMVGTPSPVILRLHANVWSYAPTWEGNYNEFGQTFAATGNCVTMVVARSAFQGVNLTCSIHDGGPSGAQIGPSRSMTSGVGDMRFIWSGGEVPTVPGHIYYVKIKGPVGNNSAVLCNNEPIPDMSDCAPEGRAYHNGVPWTQTATHPDTGSAMDLGLTICSDDDGILTNMYIRSGGQTLNASQVGQTFTARGTSLLSFCAWIPDANNTYVATLYNAVGGTQIGTAKKNRTMRWGDPECLWTWAPGECPLTPGNTYYIEVTRDGGGTVYCYANGYNVYAGGTGYANRVAQPATDMAGTIMEEESPGSATRQTVQFSTFPAVAYADRGTRSLTLRWTTDVAADSTVEYAAWNAPYTNTYYDSSPTTNHVVTLTGLLPNTMYHLRVKGAASGYRTGITRDFVACTINDTPNLLANPSFEAPAGSTSPVKPVPGWNCVGLDFGESNGNWFGEVPPYAGNWLLQGSVNGGSCDGFVYQTVYGLTPGLEYNFTCAVSSWMQENDTWKYDVWHQEGRLDNIRVGIDPLGENNPTGLNIRWTPGFYSHIRYTTVGMRMVAQSNKMTVVFSLKGRGGQWHIYGIDDCRFSEANPYVVHGLSDLKRNKANGTMAEVRGLIITATPGQAGAYYAETEDRTQGIKIVTTNSATLTSRVTVKGELATDPATGERYLTNARFASVTSGSLLKPVLMQCLGIGGPAWGLVSGVPGSVGAQNTGLLAKIAGTVKAKDSSGQYVFVNDGSMPGNGLKVDTSHIPAAYIPAVGSKVGICGISSRYYSGGVKPLLIVRSQNDIRTF